MSKGLLVIVCLLSCPPSHCILAGAEEGPLKSSTAGVFTDMGESNSEESVDKHFSVSSAALLSYCQDWYENIHHLDSWTLLKE